MKFLKMYELSLVNKKLILKNDEEVIYEYQYSDNFDLTLETTIMEFGIKYIGTFFKSYHHQKMPFIIWECLGNIYFLHCDDDQWHNLIIYQ